MELYAPLVPKKAANQGTWQGNVAGIHEVAEILGVTKSSVSRWAAKGLLPEPYDNLQLGRVWLVRDIEKLKGTLPSAAGAARGKALRAGARQRREWQARKSLPPIHRPSK